MATTNRNTLSSLLYPLSLLYGMVVWFRNALFDYQIIKSREFPIPVISVGNITVGGTGKTPLIEYIIGILKTDSNVASLSRGYRRKTRNFILSGQDPSVMEIGDEPVQIKNKFPDVHVAVDRRRVNGIEQLMERIPDLDVILLDDAYQHRHVNPGLSILLIDFNRPLSEDRLLPSGRLREQAYERRRANIILVTKCPDRLKPIEQRLIVKDLKLYPFQHLFFTKLSYGDPIPVFKDSEKTLDMETLKASKPNILMVTGISSPRLYKKHLRGISTRITQIAFPDHHLFSEKDIQRISDVYESLEGENNYIFTTAKDAMRLRNFSNIEPSLQNKMFYVPVGVKFLNDDTENFNTQIRNYVRSNKRDSILHKQANRDQA
jgi:tetraacyldisaccharide 4'-kinase